MDSQKIRKGKYLKTILVDEYRETVFHEIDNLDSKRLEETSSNYEEIFVRIREILRDKPWCCDNQEDVLFICQTISDELKQNLLIRKDNS